MHRERPFLRRSAAALGATAALLLPACGNTDPGAAAGGGTATDGAGLIVGTPGGSFQEALRAVVAVPFEQQSGIKVSVLDSDQVAQARVAEDNGATPPVDITSPNAGVLADLSREGYLAPIDYAEFGEQLVRQIPQADRGEHFVGSSRMAHVLCFNTTAFPKGAPQPVSWSDYVDTNRFPGRRGMWTWDANPQPEFGLLARGTPTSALYPLDVDQAIETVAGLDVTFAADPAALLQSLADGNFVMTPCMNHRAQVMIREGAPIAVSMNQARLETSKWAVWKSAAHKDAAMKFLAFMLQPEQQAAFARAVVVTPVNTAAIGMLPDAERDRFPTQEEDDAFIRDDTWYSAPGPDGQSNMRHLVAQFGANVR